MYIDLDRSLTLDGVNYPLKIKIKKVDDDYSLPILYFTLPIPDGYVSEYTKNTEDKNMVFINISYIEDEHYLYLDLFQSNLYRNKYLSKDERNSLKGIGRSVLCKVCSYLMGVYGLGENTPIKLKAAGGVGNSGDNLCEWAGLNPYEYLSSHKINTNDELMDINDGINRGIINLSNENLRILNFLGKTYPDTLAKMNTYQMRWEEPPNTFFITLLQVICDITNNQKLTKYYNETYGFEITNDDDGTLVDMETTLSTILSKCGNKPAVAYAGKKYRM